MSRFNHVLAAALLTEAISLRPVSLPTGQPESRSQAAPTHDTGPAAPARPFELTVDRIMRGPDLVGWTPTGLRWSARFADTLRLAKAR